MSNRDAGWAGVAVGADPKRLDDVATDGAVAGAEVVPENRELVEAAAGLVVAPDVKRELVAAAGAAGFASAGAVVVVEENRLEKDEVVAGCELGRVCWLGWADVGVGDAVEGLCPKRLDAKAAAAPGGLILRALSVLGAVGAPRPKKLLVAGLAGEVVGVVDSSALRLVSGVVWNSDGVVSVLAGWLVAGKKLGADVSVVDVAGTGEKIDAAGFETGAAGVGFVVPADPKMFVVGAVVAGLLKAFPKVLAGGWAGADVGVGVWLTNSSESAFLGSASGTGGAVPGASNTVVCRASGSDRPARLRSTSLCENACGSGSLLTVGRLVRSRYAVFLSSDENSRPLVLTNSQASSIVSKRSMLFSAVIVRSLGVSRVRA